MMPCKIWCDYNLTYSCCYECTDKKCKEKELMCQQSKEECGEYIGKNN